MSDIAFSRRAALMGLAAGGAAMALSPRLAAAKAPLAGPLRPNAHRFVLGGFEVGTVFDGAAQLDGPYPIFGEDQFEEDVAELLSENFLPSNRFEIGFTPVVVNTGSEVVLFDTGYGAARRPGQGLLPERLGALGLSPEQVDVVVITHYHPDHISGLTTDGAPTYANARYVAPESEHNWWRANSAVRGAEYEQLLGATVFSVEEKTTFLKDGQDVVGGITLMDAGGHTPGHSAFHLESDGRRMLITADAANHYVASLQRPDWHVRFDMDKEQAAATRKKLFGMLAADKIPFSGYHMPFPSVGFVEAMEGEGFRYVPAAYQLYL